MASIVVCSKKRRPASLTDAGQTARTYFFSGERVVGLLNHAPIYVFVDDPRRADGAAGNRLYSFV
jgi:hypothetical protein